MLQALQSLQTTFRIFKNDGAGLLGPISKLLQTSGEEIISDTRTGSFGSNWVASLHPLCKHCNHCTCAWIQSLFLCWSRNPGNTFE